MSNREFTYGFDELEICPGLMAAGEAEFIKRANDSFEMTGLSLYWHPTESLRITNDSDWIWKAIEAALIKYDDVSGVISDAYDKANADEFDSDYWRDERIERMRIDLL